jgi:hypothetical protein
MRYARHGYGSGNATEEVYKAVAQLHEPTVTPMA